MSKVLVFVEYATGGLKKGSLELLTCAKKSGREGHALMIGPEAQKLAPQAGEYGAGTVWAAVDEKLYRYNPELFTAVAVGAIKNSGADVVLASSSMLARDLFPR